MSPLSKGRVLVVDDDVDLAQLLERYLLRADLDITVRHDGNAAVDAVNDFKPDVMVLDLGLPGIDGIEVCRQVRSFSNCHVLMLTARDDEVDKIVGLSVGADDYVTKPFSPREVVARVQAMLRRAQTQPAPGPTNPPSSDKSLTVGDLKVDLATRDVLLREEIVLLTRTEFELLALLATHPHQVISRRQMVESVWATAWTGDPHLVDVHIGRIRKKLGDDASSPRFIRTVRGVGYRMGDG
ncbi:response regulator transcription factor [Kocuria sp. CPCC 205235]|uniref:response regulator n=1 Tax=Kocuria sp. CPCC 205235 TaxID=3073549 RepID=UPI0034D59B7C